MTTNSKVARMTWNRAFPINHEDAGMRYKMARLRRDTWLVSKERRFLDHALHVHIACRNLVRGRFNYDKESPAQMLGFLPRRLTRWEVLGWAQRWGKRSRHPLSPRGKARGEREMNAVRVTPSLREVQPSRSGHPLLPWRSSSTPLSLI